MKRFLDSPFALRRLHPRAQFVQLAAPEIALQAPQASLACSQALSVSPISSADSDLMQ